MSKVVVRFPRLRVQSLIKQMQTQLQLIKAKRWRKSITEQQAVAQGYKVIEEYHQKFSDEVYKSAKFENTTNEKSERLAQQLEDAKAYWKKLCAVM